jgi:hypothetical protein
MKQNLLLGILAAGANLQPAFYATPLSSRLFMQFAVSNGKLAESRE